MLAGLSARRLTSVQFPRRPCGPSPGLGARTHQSTFSPKGHPSSKSQAPSYCPHFFSIPVPAASRPSFRSLKLKRHMPMSFRPLCLCSVCLFTDFPPGHDRRHEIEPVFLTLLAMRTTTVKSLVAMPSIVMGFCRWPSLIGPATPFGNSQEIFRNSGTDGSNPVPPNGESATNRAPEISQRREDKRSARCKKMDRLS